MDDKQKRQLIDIAKESIINGLRTGKPLDISLGDFDGDLQTKRATFVTLNKYDQLRGCIGILEPQRPLVQDVAYNAFAAAFSDHRFPAVTADEIDQLDIHISILATPEEMSFSSEDDLVSQLRPGVDGLIIQEGMSRGTFLPSVWESLSDRHDFLIHLKQKAGLPGNYWSDTIRVRRYTVEKF